MMTDVPFDDLVGRLRRRDDGAARVVFDRFAPRLVSLARRRLHGKVLRKLDPEDVVQSVFGIFFDRLADGRFVVPGWENLGRLLARITTRRCAHWNDYYDAQKRDPAAEVPVEDGQLLAGGAIPSAVAVCRETVEQLLRGLDEAHRQVVLLGLEGMAVPEISRRLRCSERTVYRVLLRVRKRFRRAC